MGKEQVEEITKERNEIKDIMTLLDKCTSLNPMYKAEVATVIYGNNYRKLPDGATVLLVGKYNQSLDEKTIEYFIKHNEQIRKETAEKIFNDIFALVNNAKDKSSKIFGNSSDYGKGYKNSVNHFNEHILELAKQFGLEIKE